MSKPNVAGPVITEKGPVDFGGLIGDPVSANPPTEREPIVTPPPIPEVDRETGAVSTSRTEDIGQLESWINSTEPTEGHDWNNGPDYARPNKRPANHDFTVGVGSY